MSKATEWRHTIAHGVSRGIECNQAIKPRRGDISLESHGTTTDDVYSRPSGAELTVVRSVPTAHAVGYRMPPLRG